MLKRKWLSALLATTLLLGILPTTVLAANDTPETVWKDMDFRDATEDASGTGWEWTNATSTLTMTGFRAVLGDDDRIEKAAILLPADSTVVLEGYNYITTHSYRCSAISADGDLTFTGDGELNIAIDAVAVGAIAVDDGVVSFEDRVKINVDAPKHVIYVTEASKNDVSVSVQDHAKIIYSDSLTDEAVQVIVKYRVKTDTIVLDYEEDHDKTDRTITLIKTTKKPVKPEEKPTEPANTYEMVIGNAEITKNGVAAYHADAVPYLSKNGFTMLPLRALLVVSDPNTEIQWDAKTRTATVKYDGKTFQIFAEKNVMTQNGESIFMTTPSEFSNRRLFVSLRDWMTIMDIPESQVSWDATTKTVTLKN